MLDIDGGQIKDQGLQGLELHAECPQSMMRSLRGGAVRECKRGTSLLLVPQNRVCLEQADVLGRGDLL